jgi:hypothetical protein
LHAFVLQLGVSGDDDVGLLITNGNNILTSKPDADPNGCGSKKFAVACIDATGAKLKVRGLVPVLVPACTHGTNTQPHVRGSTSPLRLTHSIACILLFGFR